VPGDKRGKNARGQALPQVRRDLPDGRRLELVAGAAGEQLEIRTERGELEVSIRFDRGGPVVRVHGARLELETVEELKLRCGRFEVESREGAELVTGGNFVVRSRSEIRMKSKEQTFVDGDWVNINCLERTGYHDDPARALDVEPEEVDPAKERDPGS